MQVTCIYFNLKSYSSKGLNSKDDVCLFSLFFFDLILRFVVLSVSTGAPQGLDFDTPG